MSRRGMLRRGTHGAYRHFFCPKCTFGVPANHWRKHRRKCEGLPVGSKCERCGDDFPCRKRGCPNLEIPKAVSEKKVPALGVVRSLQMKVGRLADGRWTVSVPWLVDTIIADTWEEAYWIAVRTKEED